MGDQANRGTRALIGALLALGGLATMAGWLFHETSIVRILPGSPMVFGTAFGFSLAGGALVWGFFAPALREPLYACASLVLAALGLLALAQSTLGIAAGIDLPTLHAWIADPGRSRTPGRILPATGVGLVLAGAVFLLAPRVRGGGVQAFIVPGLTAAIGALGALAVIGHLLDLSDVLEIHWLNQVPWSAALGFVLLSLGLWLDWRGEAWNPSRMIRGEDDRIALAGALVLALSIIAGGLVVFWVMFSHMERALVNDLAFDLKHRRILMVTAIKRAIAETADVGERPNIRRLYAAQLKDPVIPDINAFLSTVAQSMLRSGFTAFAFVDGQGREIGRAGAFFEQSDLAIRLPQDREGLGATLLWNNGFLLEVRALVTSDGTRLGEVRGQHRLADLEGITTDTAELGATGEFALCGMRTDKLHCAPTRFQPRAFDVPLVIDGKRLPMSYAMAGETGVLKLTDYRGQRVLAAYSPLGPGTSLVLKNDLSELYAPIRKRVGFLAAALLLVTLAGGWALRWRVRPLVRGLVLGEERLRAALEGSKLAVWDWNLRTGRVQLSEQWAELLGGRLELTDTTIGDLGALMHPEDAKAVGEMVGAMLKGTISHYAIEHRVRTLSGEWKWIRSRGQVAVRSRDGNALRAIGTNVDIQERKEQELQMAHRAAHDMLTGLPNRSMFNDRLEQALLRTRRAKTLMAVLYLDADKFKAVNDTYGHAAGDAVLKEFARRLAAAVRATDTVARFGGDEFAAILENLGERANGLRIAGEIVAAMRADFEIEGGVASISASIGIAFHEGTAEVDTATLLKAADGALYEAKVEGRDRYCVAA